MIDKKTVSILSKVAGIAILLVLGGEDYQLIARLENLMFNHGILGLVFPAIWLISVAALLVGAFLPNIFFRTALAVTILGATLTGLAFSNISGTYITYDNLYVLLENMNFAGEAFSHYADEILYALFIASFSFVFILPPPDSFKPYFSGFRKSFFAYSLAVSPFIVLFIIGLLRGGYGMNQTPIQYKIPVLLSMIAAEKIISNENVRENVSFAPQSAREGEKPNVVLIVEESLRGDYLDINKNRGITPYLFSKKARLANFGYASSGANCSAESNQILRFGPKVSDFERTFQTNPSIWQYAKKAGYQTVMIEGQVKKGHLNNRMGKEELSYIDQFIYSKGENGYARDGKNGYQRDMDISKNIKRLISASEESPLFILAVKSGVHFPYNTKVPEEEKKYKSKSKAYAIVDRENLINSYKNAIAYLIDDFFRDLMEEMTYRKTLIFYTSDHGQNLLDNDKRMNQCSTENPSPYEGLVPLWVLTENEFYKPMFDQAALKNRDKASHFNIFPTILYLFGFQKSDVVKRHGMTLLDDISEPRKFMSGLLAINRIGFGSRNKINWNYLPDDFLSIAKNNAQKVSTSKH